MRIPPKNEAIKNAVISNRTLRFIISRLFLWRLHKAEEITVWFQDHHIT